MSKLDTISTDLFKLAELFVQFEEDMADVESHLKVQGKLLDKALQEQCAWPIYYSQRKVELKTLVKYLEAKVAAERGRQARRYTENYSRQLGDRVMNSYIDAEPEYIKIYSSYLKVSELYEKYEAICNAFDRRGFALRDLTAVRVHAIQSSTL